MTPAKTPTAPLHVVLGCTGPVGTALMQLLAQSSVRVRGVSRSARADAPPGVELVKGEGTDAGSVRAACEGAEVVYCCIGRDYSNWVEFWPAVARALVEGLSGTGARLVFADNLYAYGPQSAPLVESMPFTTYGRKPAVRARVDQILLDADAKGRLRVALVRASDFYGPRVSNAMLGERVFRPALQGKAAQLLFGIDELHSYTYVPDFARALVAVANAPDAFGRAWHVPNAPALTTRQVVELIYRAAGHPPKLQVLPGWLIAMLSPVVPLMKELYDMKHNWDRPYVVDHSQFAKRFGAEPTPLDVGIGATLDWYRQAAG